MRRWLLRALARRCGARRRVARRRLAGCALAAHRRCAQHRWRCNERRLRLRRAGRIEPHELRATAHDLNSGLTVVRFPDNHMIYALTWFTLCALCLFFVGRLWHMRD